MKKKCKICGGNSSKIFESIVLKKIPVSYFKCNFCDFVQTDEPFWLNEAYSSAITNQDIGLISRNINFSPLVSKLIHFFFNSEVKFLDYGGGYGMFVRLMRDQGFDFKRYDTYCENIFAKGFDCSDEEKFGLITAIEVFEHLVNPMEVIREMLEKSDNIFFTTELQPKNFNNENDWWYVMPETGQHISLFSIKTLKYLAKTFNLNLYTNGSSYHLLTIKKINPYFFKIITNKYVGLILNKFCKRHPSLLWSDYLKLTKS